MTHDSFLAFPFIYQIGTSFTPMQPDSTGLRLGRPGDLFIGHGLNIQGVIVVAQLHRAKWLWQLWDDSNSRNVPLEPLSESEAGAQRSRLQALLGMSRIRGSELTESEREMFNTSQESDTDVRFSSTDERLVRDFLTK